MRVMRAGVFGGVGLALAVGLMGAAAEAAGGSGRQLPKDTSSQLLMEYGEWCAPSDDAAQEQSPQVAGRWQFEQATGGVTPDASSAGRPLSLAGDAAIGAGWVDSGALLLDGVGDYAHTGDVPIDTSASFTVTAWAQAATLPESGATVLSAAGAERSAFAVRYEPDPAGGRGTWQIVLPEEDGPEATVVSVGNARFLDARDWNHLTLVYNSVRHQACLYVNGQLYEAACSDETDDVCGPVSWAENVRAFSAGHSIQVGRARTGPGTGADAWGEYWTGAIDDVWVIQGALNREQVTLLAAGFNDIPTVIPPIR